VHAARGSVAVLDGGAFKEPATREAAKALESWGAARPTLVALGENELPAAKSFRNIERVSVVRADAVGVSDVVGAASLVLSREALEELTRRAAETTTSPNRTR
jgi:large subunit ribosomal protein L4